MADKMLHPGEVAALFAVDPRTVAKWAKAGKLPCIITPGGHRRYRQSDVDRYLKPSTPEDRVSGRRRGDTGTAAMFAESGPNPPDGEASCAPTPSHPRPGPP